MTGTLIKRGTHAYGQNVVVFWLVYKMAKRLMGSIPSWWCFWKVIRSWDAKLIDRFVCDEFITEWTIRRCLTVGSRPLGGRGVVLEDMSRLGPFLLLGCHETNSFVLPYPSIVMYRLTLVPKSNGAHWSWTKPSEPWAKVNLSFFKLICSIILGIGR
jgi:hypothetical protein